VEGLVVSRVAKAEWRLPPPKTALYAVMWCYRLGFYEANTRQMAYAITRWMTVV